VNKPLIAEFASLSDYGKIFAADYLAVHADDEVLEQAVRYGQKAQGFQFPQPEVVRAQN